MSTPTYSIRSALRRLRHTARREFLIVPASRGFTTTTSRYNEAPVETTSTLDSTPLPPPSAATLDPNLVVTRKEERLLLNTGRLPIGSRRRRAALHSTSGIPFEQLPYLCFQEARKVLAADRAEKLAQIEEQRKRIAKVAEKLAEEQGGEKVKKGRLTAMHMHLENLKILADINDPVIKKRFEDGQGDMNRPIYRHLATKSWHSYRRPVLLQRITQMSVIPDLLPHLSPTADVTLSFAKRTVHPGDFVDSRVSEIPAKLGVQVFDKGEHLVTVVVIDPDVPDLRADGFKHRCHFLAVNIPVSPTRTSLPLSRLSATEQTVLPWLPPFAQQGTPYHRLSVFVLQQPEGTPLDHRFAKEWARREKFNLRSFADKFNVKPVGVHMFRSVWDEGTEGVMRRAGVEGWDVVFERKKPEKLPYKKKDGARYRGFR